MRLFATYRFGCAVVPGLRSPVLLRFARNDTRNGRHCEEQSDEAISIGLSAQALRVFGLDGGVIVDELTPDERV